MLARNRRLAGKRCWRGFDGLAGARANKKEGALAGSLFELNAGLVSRPSGRAVFASILEVVDRDIDGFIRKPEILAYQVDVSLGVVA